MNESGIASKKEALARIEAMRAKAIGAAKLADEASRARPIDGLSPDYDAAMLFYQRCVTELEAAINAGSIWSTEPKEDE